MAVPKIIQIPEGDKGALQYHYTRVEVSSAEILALNSAPKELVEAPGAGNILVPINAITKLHFGTVVYATNTDLKVVHNGLTTELIGLQFLITQAADWIALKALTSQLYASANAENKSLDLHCDTGDPTGGDGTLVIYLWYINLIL